MNDATREARLHIELKAKLDAGLTSGRLLSSEQVLNYTGVFRNRFGPDVLRELDGEALLRLMHGRDDKQSRSLAYWLEFKNDEEFPGNRFGGIGGGSAMKFGIYQRQSDSAWMSGSHTKPQALPLDEAVQIARRQRDELLAGCAVLDRIDVSHPEDDAYARLQTEMENAAPELSRDGWAHKYWFLVYPSTIDDYHSPRYQRFHLFKLLQMPPDQIGILDNGAPRFNCAGRFISMAKNLSAPVNTLNTVLNERDGAFHRYWRVGTKAGDTGESQWHVMREGGFVSIGWHEHLPNLSDAIGQDKATARAKIREWLSPNYPDNPGSATRKSGEVLNFASEVSESDLVLACDGQTVLGVGRVRGPYEYDEQLDFPHKRPVEWLLLEPWPMPHPEGLRTTVFELGKYANNLLAVEERLFDQAGAPRGAPAAGPSITVAISPPPPLDPFTMRVENILSRKGQVVLYGPPGTGKTYNALKAAKELAARRAFRRPFVALSPSQQGNILGEDGNGLVRLCTFHPGYGYEDFIEGFRPKTAAGGQMVFEPRDGVFKRLCDEAAKNQQKHYFLIIDEINRGDVPRIFGELLTVIETDKRGVSVTLPVTGRTFRVPRNIFVVGTMNTADRSISLLDAALRRRFGFIELMPDSSILGQRCAGKLPLGPWLDALNTRLRKALKRDARNLQIGHAYFLPNPPITSVADFARVLRDDIVPLVEEYCYDDFATLKEILGADLVDTEAEAIRDELFAPNREEDLVEAVWFEEMQPLVLKQEAEIGSAQEPDDFNERLDGDDSDA